MSNIQLFQDIVDKVAGNALTPQERAEEARRAQERHVREWREAFLQTVKIDRAAVAFDTPELTPAIQAVRTWREKAQVIRHLLLLGDVGAGKSTAAAHALKYYLEPGRFKAKSAWLSPDELTEVMQKPYWDDTRIVPHYAVIDDLGTEKSDAFSEALCRFLDLRGRVAIMTSNLTASQIKERYNLRLIDRLRSSCWVTKGLGRTMRDPVGDF